MEQSEEAKDAVELPYVSIALLLRMQVSDRIDVRSSLTTCVKVVGMIDASQYYGTRTTYALEKLGHKHKRYVMKSLSHKLTRIWCHSNVQGRSEGGDIPSSIPVVHVPPGDASGIRPMERPMVVELRSGPEDASCTSCGASIHECVCGPVRGRRDD